MHRLRNHIRITDGEVKMVIDAEIQKRMVLNLLKALYDLSDEQVERLKQEADEIYGKNRKRMR